MAKIVRAEAAAIAGVTVATFSSYVARGQAPKPVDHVSRTPLWDADEIREWMANRPGRGSQSTPRSRRRAEERARPQDPQ